MLILRITSQRFRHDFRFAEEESAIAEVLPDVFQVGVAHVVHAEDEDVLVGFCCCADGGEEGGGFGFRGFLLDGGGVDYSGALGFGHCGGVRWVVTGSVVGLVLDAAIKKSFGGCVAKIYVHV